MYEKIKINVGGQSFATKRMTIQRHENTKLANIEDTCEYYDEKTKEYFFDRNPLIFQSILDYYRTGKLHFLSNVCPQHIREELEFWGISTTDLGACCWKHFYTVDSDMKTVCVIEKHFFDRKCKFVASNQKVERIKNRIWAMLENPRVCTTALVWQIFYMTVVLVAIVVSILQSFELASKNGDRTGNQTSYDVRERLTDNDGCVMVITHLCNVIFTLETTLRLITCPDKMEFLQSFLNIIDILSVVGYFISIIVFVISDTGENYKIFFIFIYLLIILRGFRFFRLERFIEGLRLMLLSIRQSKKMLCLLVLVLVITSVIFGITIHVMEMEMEMDGPFSDPISSFYWAIITMTTIGYGDIYPKTASGRIVASICATVGIFLLSMPIAVIANTFTDLYNRYTERYNHNEQQKRNACCSFNNKDLIPVKF